MSDDYELNEYGELVNVKKTIKKSDKLYGSFIDEINVETYGKEGIALIHKTFSHRKRELDKKSKISLSELQKINDKYLSIFSMFGFFKCNHCKMFQAFTQDPIKKEFCDMCIGGSKKSELLTTDDDPICLKCNKKISYLETRHFFSSGFKNCLCNNCFPYNVEKLNNYGISKDQTNYKLINDDLDNAIDDIDNLIKELKFRDDIKVFNSIVYILDSIFIECGWTKLAYFNNYLLHIDIFGKDIENEVKTTEQLQFELNGNNKKPVNNRKERSYYEKAQKKVNSAFNSPIKKYIIESLKNKIYLKTDV